MKNLTASIVAFFLSTSALAECPTLGGKWLVTFNQQTEGQFSHDDPGIGRLFAGTSAVFLDYAEAINFAPAFVTEINRKSFGLPLYGEHCSFVLLELVPDPTTLVGWTIVGFFKGKHRFHFILHTGDELETGQGEGQRVWIP